MALTNVQIIDANKQKLAAAGVLKFTGRAFQAVDENGNEILIPEIETIHTFNGWKELGYKVKKGEHAKARFAIWKHAPGKVETDDGEEEHGRGRCFMKEACWFTFEQVESMVNNV